MSSGSGSGATFVAPAAASSSASSAPAAEEIEATAASSSSSSSPPPSSSSDTQLSKYERKNIKELSKVLNIDAKDQSLWLLKVPSFVACQWANAKHDDILGTAKVAITKPAGSKETKKEMTAKLAYENNDTTEEQSLMKYPEDFTFEEVKKQSDNETNFLAFSTDQETNGFALDGKITKEYILKPAGTIQYKNFIKDRGILAKKSTRTETFQVDLDDVQKAAMQSQTVEFIISDKSELKRKAAVEKFSVNKTMNPTDDEADSSELRGKIFEAFAVNERQTFKDIMAYCSCVEGFTREESLRDMLKRYAKYHQKGTYKHFWELKQEYRNYSVDCGNVV